MTRRRSAALLLALSAVVPACSWQDLTPPGADSASCAGPYVETTPRQAQPGESVEVLSQHQLSGCYDTGQLRAAEPLPDLPVTLTQGTSSTRYDPVDAHGSDGVLRTTITVPSDAPPGLAEVTVGAAPPALLMVGDGTGGFPPWPGPPEGPFTLTVELESMPAFAEGGYVVASATTVDFQVPDQDKQVVVVQPLGPSELSFGQLRPTYWMVDISVHRCLAAGCAPPPTAPPPTSGCRMETRIYDSPVRMTYQHAGSGAGPCQLGSVSE